MNGNNRLQAAQKHLAAARGDIPADLVIHGADVINVFTGELESRDIAVCGERVVGLGDYRGLREVDARGMIAAPGFIEGHIHIESTLLAPAELARAVVPRGTTAMVADPHEITNVMGSDGVEFMLEATRNLPVDVHFLLPSCVPATDMETAGGSFGVEEMLKFKGRPRVLGLAEVMNFPGVVNGLDSLLEKLALFEDSIRDGHAPLLSGRALNAYLFAGPRSDHECTTLEEAREKLARGMFIMIREGTQARNLDALLSLVTAETSRRMMLVTDDRHPGELLSGGHLDHNLRRAIRRGLNPATAIQMVTLNAAEYFGFADRGAIAPGYRADIVLLENLEEVIVNTVFFKGNMVAREGLLQLEVSRSSECLLENTVRIAAISEDSFRIPAGGETARVIRVVPGQLLTETVPLRVLRNKGEVRADPGNDVIKLAVVERHHRTGRVGLGLVTGLGLRRGALASSVAHDSHNIVIAGVHDEAMVYAVREIERMGGGMAVALESGVTASLPLPLAGLMSLESAEAVVRSQQTLMKAVRELGCALDNPFMALSFLALPVIPELKLTDRGLVDVNEFRIVPLFI